MSLLAPRFRQPLSRDFAAAVVAAVLLVFVPVAAYSSYPSVFGESASLKLFFVCGLGMSTVFSLYVGRGKRLTALVPGLVAGLAGTGLYFVPHALLGVALSRYWTYFAFVVGALLGLLLYWLARKLRGDPRGP